jgi:hypothetical protein
MPTFSPSPLIAAGDELVTRINAVTWTPSGGSALTFTARRRGFVPEYQPTDTTLYVDLIAMTDEEKELDDRGGGVVREYTVAIVVQKVMTDKTSLSELDALVNFLQALADFFPLEIEMTITGSSPAQKFRCTTSNVPIEWAPDELDKNGRYYGVAHLQFTGWY